ncbi:hemerythrin domain-containing protein [Thermocatellispora tengchongensis]|uniref:hemerythrin domain-containing protein n=1 Tax=Thermocatellispora tengchongensis TaxID=1073253 RepID=UPI003624B75A
MGEALRLVHDAFRRELALIRKEAAQAGPRLGAQLRVNCLTLCGGLHYHHTQEDGGMFPALAGRHPELAPVMDRLGREHERMAVLLGELQDTLSAAHPDADAVRAEVERLTGLLEEHLTYEEEQLIPFLDAPGT